MPLLAIFKIVADRIDLLKPVGHIIGSQPFQFDMPVI
jgi:hypothetical protein